jgi:hypothetical protein
LRACRRDGRFGSTPRRARTFGSPGTDSNSAACCRPSRNVRARPSG